MMLHFDRENGKLLVSTDCESVELLRLLVVGSAAVIRSLAGHEPELEKRLSDDFAAFVKKELERGEPMIDLSQQ